MNSNSNSIQNNGMQIDGEGIQSFIVYMVLGKKTLKGHKFKKMPFHGFSFGNGLNKFQFEIIQSMMTYEIYNYLT
jgi:hypothetical protein